MSSIVQPLIWNISGFTDTCCAGGVHGEPLGSKYFLKGKQMLKKIINFIISFFRSCKYCVHYDNEINFCKLNILFLKDHKPCRWYKEK